MIKSFKKNSLIAFTFLSNLICSGQNDIVEKPNVIFIAVDDLNDWAGYMGGHPQAKTPNIDRLANKGIAFTRAYSSAPLCNPSRVSLLTGILPSNSGVYGNQENFREYLPNALTLMQYFKKYGYKTMGGGKIFHRYNHIGDSASWDQYFIIKTDNRNPRNNNSKFKGRDKNLPHKNLFNWGPIDVNDEEMSDVKVTNWAISEIQKEHEKPFFLAFGFTKPHLPWYVPRKYFKKFPLDQIILPTVLDQDLNDLPPFGKKLAKEVYQVSTGKNFNGIGVNEHKLVLKHKQWAKGVQAYLATINFADKYLGKFLDALDKSKYADNTIVVLWGDHGWHLGEKEHWRKMALWEDSTRTPLIIYQPNKIKNNSIVDTPISFIDIYPTLIDMCGLPPKKDDIDGKSFFQLLKNPTQNWDKPVLMTFGEGNHAVRTNRWRYIQYYDGTNELYDHKNDPNEWINISGNKKYINIIEELRQHIPKKEKAQLISHNNMASELIRR